MNQRNENSQRGWTDGVGHWLIHHAANRAPETFAQRLREEWLADLTARRSAISRLRFAIGCCWATQVIAYEHQPTSVPVTGYAPHGFGDFSHRSGTLFLVVSLHAVLLYGIVSTLSHIQRSKVIDPLVNRVLAPTLPHELPFRLPDPTLNDTTVEARPPVLDIPRDPDPPRDPKRDVIQDSSPPLSPPALAHLVKQVQGGPGAGFPDPDDFYPALARYKEEQGVATVRVCVDANGRLTSAPTTITGTGSSRLDEGALKLARAGSGYYRPTTEDGRPVSSCYPFRIRFQIKN